MEHHKIVIIGAGNVATYFAASFAKAKHIITQVYHPNLQKAQTLAATCNANAIDAFDALDMDAVIYFIAVKDAAIADVLQQLPALKGIVAHTSGTVGLINAAHLQHTAVFYPLQTFTKNIPLEHTHFPILIEAKHAADQELLINLAHSLKNEARLMDSETRAKLHLAAVFACNFSNHCIKLAYDLMEKQQLNPELILPLIQETMSKLNHLTPQQAQTGPAMRGDSITIEKHIELLSEHQNLQEIYKLLTASIQEK